MPSLTTISLSKYYAFQCKITTHKKSTSSSSLSFLDITSALKRVLNAPKIGDIPPPLPPIPVPEHPVFELPFPLPGRSFPHLIPEHFLE